MKPTLRSLSAASSRVLIGIAVIVAAQACPPAFSQWVEYDNHWYAVTSPGDWHHAEAVAVRAGGHLATVDSSVENEWLYTTFFARMTDVGVWIGFYQDTSDPLYAEPGGGWKWISGAPVIFFIWGGLEPNNQGGEDYAVLERTPTCCQWNDLGAPGNGYPASGTPGVVELESNPLGDWFWYGGHSYALTTPGDWDHAEAIAVLAGGHLATINSSEENEWLYDTFYTGMTDVGAWIGFYQDPNDPLYSEPGGGWKWISGDPVSFFIWGGLEPNNQGGSENHAVLERTPTCCQWNDIGPTSAGYPVGGVPGIVKIVDCNANGVVDSADISTGFSQDCNNNDIPDECEPDCDGDGIPDDCDLDNSIPGDHDGDGDVDLTDLAIVLSNFGRTCPQP